MIRTIKPIINLGFSILNHNSNSLQWKVRPILIHTQAFMFNSRKPEDNDRKPEDNDRKPDDNDWNREEGQKPQQNEAYQGSLMGKYLMGASIFFLGLALLMMQIQEMRINNKGNKHKKKVYSTGKARVGGEWELLDTEGRNFSSKDLEGSYYLIYFGFTNCPDICPNSLTKLGRAIKQVKNRKEAKYFKLKSVFVSVDPDRDTPQKIEKFIRLFDPEMIGVTGRNNEDAALRECMNKFKIYASRIEIQNDEIIKGRKQYTIDHTILTYLMDENNEYINHLGANLSEHELAQTILEGIVQNEKNKMKKLKL